jgi:hypothetical protein
VERLRELLNLIGGFRAPVRSRAKRTIFGAHRSRCEACACSGYALARWRSRSAGALHFAARQLAAALERGLRRGHRPATAGFHRLLALHAFNLPGAMLACTVLLGLALRLAPEQPSLAFCVRREARAVGPIAKRLRRGPHSVLVGFFFGLPRFSRCVR